MRKDINSVIHASANADFDNFIYTEVLVGAGASPTINGTTTTLPAGAKFEILLKSISATANVYVLGYPKTISYEPQIL